MITSLFAGHCAPCAAAAVPVGAHAGGFGLVALTGFEFDARVRERIGIVLPVRVARVGRLLEVKVAGWPLIVIDVTVMFGPGVVVLVTLFVRSKSRLKSVRHCVGCCCEVDVRAGQEQVRRRVVDQVDVGVDARVAGVARLGVQRGMPGLDERAPAGAAGGACVRRGDGRRPRDVRPPISTSRWAVAQPSLPAPLPP